MRFVVDDEPLGSSAAQSLIQALNRELEARYPEPGATHFRLDDDEVSGGRGAFVVAREAGTLLPVGCAAFRLDTAGVAEIKRMYVDPLSRGRGIATLLLGEVEARARRLGATRFVLETGARQLEAIALYERAGYQRVAPFGEYVDSPLSVCMAKGATPLAR